MPRESRMGYAVCKKCAGVGWLMTDAEEQEQKHYEKARKIRLDDAKQYKMFYSDRYYGNEGYFSAEDICDVIDYCDLGGYVWGTTYSPLKIYASDIVSNATEDSWEGAYDAINPYDIAKLQEQLDDFCDKANRSGAGTYYVDYTTAILL